MRRLLLGTVVVLVAAVLAVPAQAGPAQRADSSSQQAAGQTSTVGEYLVLYANAADAAAGRAAVEAAGGTVVSENKTVGLATVKTSNPNFFKTVNGQRGVASVMANKPVGRLPDTPTKPDPAAIDERLVQAVKSATAGASHGSGRGGGGGHGVANEPLANRQWDMRMVDATPTGSYRFNQGRSDVLVGIIDSGIDASHPDLKRNFNRRLSRNFTTDIPLIDGPCEQTSCVDPPDVDDNGHGTHVAGIVAASLNGLGTAGVAPRVSLVNIRGGQDGGFLFLQPVVNAITYAGTIGVDVINMSFFIDPWLFNCLNNPGETPEQQAEQRLIREATQRAISFARSRGVLPINSLGNENTDLDNPTVDHVSPDFPPPPPGTVINRPVDNSCLVVPAELEGVVATAALGPSGRKSFYSNWSFEEADVSAPGGDTRDFPGTTQTLRVENAVLSTYPQVVLERNDLLNPDGTPKVASVIRDCKGSTCAYYRYLQGTSMAAPHATGVAALIVGVFGHRDHRHGGRTLDARVTERILRATATKTPCPFPAELDYPDLGPEFTALCEGTLDHNDFYGDGIVNALSAVLR